jgi:hypothetical protein
MLDPPPRLRMPTPTHPHSYPSPLLRIPTPTHPQAYASPRPRILTPTHPHAYASPRLRPCLHAQGAKDVTDLKDYAEEMADDLGLKRIEKNKLVAGLKSP